MEAGNVMLLQSRKHGCPSGHAPGAHVGVTEPNSRFGQFVNIRGMCPIISLRIRANGSVALIVCENEKDVGRIFGSPEGQKIAEEQGKGEK